MVEEYKDNYSKIDDNKSAVFSSNDFNIIGAEIELSKEFIDSTSVKINQLLGKINDIIPLETYSSHNLMLAHDEAKEHLLKIRGDVEECEQLDSEFTNVEASVEVLRGFLRAKDTNALEAKFDNIIEIANGYYPNKKEDTNFGNELNEYSKEVTGELIESTDFYKSIGNAADYYAVKQVIKDGLNDPMATLKVDEKLFGVSDYFYDNAEMLEGLGKYVGKGLIIGGFAAGVYKDIKKGLPAGQSVMKNGLSTVSSIAFVSAIPIIVGGALGTATLPVVATVGLAAFSSYIGAKVGKCLYYKWNKNISNPLAKKVEKYSYVNAISFSFG